MRHERLSTSSISQASTSAAKQFRRTPVIYLGMIRLPNILAKELNISETEVEYDLFRVSMLSR